MSLALTNNNEMEIMRIKTVLDAAALVYAPEEHGPLLPVAFYRARDEGAHQVCINFHPEVGWRVIDLAVTFVGRLEGADDLRRSAAACARDYARQCQAVPRWPQGDPADLAPAGREGSLVASSSSSPADEQRKTIDVTDLRFPLACDPWPERAVRRFRLRSSSGSGRDRRSRP